jgi:hypothetical protein
VSRSEVIIAIGHTDPIGSVEYNLKLSVRRAEAIKAYLVSKGIQAEPDLHRRQGQGTADQGVQQQGLQEQGRLHRVPRAEPPRRDRSGRHAPQVAGRFRRKKALPRQGLFFAPHPPRRGGGVLRCGMSGPMGESVACAPHKSAGANELVAYFAPPTKAAPECRPTVRALNRPQGSARIEKKARTLKPGATSYLRERACSDSSKERYWRSRRDGGLPATSARPGRSERRAIGRSA